MYQTKDQYIAAILMCFYPDGYDHFRKERTAGRPEVWFHFKDEELADAIVQDYFSDLLSVNPRLLVDALSRVRNIYKSV